MNLGCAHRRPGGGAHRSDWRSQGPRPSDCTGLVVPELPPQEPVTGHKELDALLWLRKVISTGDPALIDKAMMEKSLPDFIRGAWHVVEPGTDYIPGWHIDSTFVIGLHSDWVEAIAFAWLAKSFIEGRAGNLSAVTGASRQAILGCFHPAA